MTLVVTLRCEASVGNYCSSRLQSEPSACRRPKGGEWWTAEWNESYPPTELEGQIAATCLRGSVA